MVTLYQFQIESPLSTEALLDHLKTSVRESPEARTPLKRRFGEMPAEQPPFIGYVYKDSCLVYRDIRYRNPFLPRIRGVVRPREGGCTMEVCMGLHPMMFLLVCFWLGVVCAAGVIKFSQCPLVYMLIPLAVLAFSVALTGGCFYPEAVKGRHMLETILGDAGGKPFAPPES